MKEMLFNKVLVLVDEDATKTESGLELVKEEKELPLKGEVIMAGHLMEKVKQGDRVMFGSFSGTKLLINDKPHVVIDERLLFAII